MVTLQDPAQRFYGDLSPQEQQHWVEQLMPNSIRVMKTPVSNDQVEGRCVIFLATARQSIFSC